MDLDAQPEFDIIDEYDSEDVESKPFPLVYHVDCEKEKIYLLSIEESYRKTRS